MGGNVLAHLMGRAGPRASAGPTPPLPAREGPRHETEDEQNWTGGWTYRGPENSMGAIAGRERSMGATAGMENSMGATAGMGNSTGANAGMKSPWAPPRAGKIPWAPTRGKGNQPGRAGIDPVRLAIWTLNG